MLRFTTVIITVLLMVGVSAQQNRRPASPEGQAQLTTMRAFTRDRKLILRVDRVEPSKNVLRGFIAYRNFTLLDTASGNGTAAFDAEYVFNRH